MKSSMKSLKVFDFDDTLVKTDSVVRVTNAEGKKLVLTPHDFVSYDKQPGDVFDYSDFAKLINPRPIQWVCELLVQTVRYHGPESAAVLSARHTNAPIIEWLKSWELSDVEAVGLGTPASSAKAEWVSERIQRLRLRSVEYWDDSSRHIAAIQGLRDKHPEVSFAVYHVLS